MTISTSQATTIIDNLTKSILDLETSFVTNPASVSPTVATITAGQFGASNALQAHIAALSAADQAGQMGATWLSTADAVQAYAETANTQVYKLFVPMMRALDTDLGGLREFLLLNSLQVNSEFAAAFNWMVTNTPSTSVAPSPLSPAVIFPDTEVILGSVAVTGAAAGTFTAGVLGTNLYAAQALYIKNTAGVTSGGTTTSFTITYTNAAGLTTATVTQALGATLAAGAKIAAGSAVGSAVSAITINSGGVASDEFAIVIEAARAVAY
jgi:hypothetical protein